ncbi:hypothetical protein BUALT_Bualt06G0032700 [Buddleja alternifolia]|uniref:Uncharacterized protein n=1 Tax=Buddleja alternifolia TaxID=168488 RepID=A0AAV6XJN5_9LAMI|nr:hypothetical protein BUALT_Bualt06G0032700 [Buddleja alternifolia]
MPMGYQPPKLQQLDGKGNPKQHVAHFMETCNNAGTDGDLLVKQYVRSLKRNAFDCTRRIMGMIELTNAKQWKDEPVVDYINGWRALSLNCKDKLSEISAVEMCIQGMHWGLLYILQGIKPRNFEELATRAHDTELCIANHGANFPLEDQRKEKKDFKKLIELPEPKRPEEAGKVNDPKYCKYHRVVSHPIEKCFVVKDKIMALARDGKIILDSEDVADANHASIDVVTSDSQHKVFSLSSSAKAPSALQFGSLETAMVKVLLADEGTMNEENSIDKFEEDGEWILVTRRQRQRHCIDELHPLFLKNSYPPTVRKPNPMKVLKTPHVNFKKPSKSNHRTPVTLNDFFPKKFFESKGALPLKAPTSSQVEKIHAKSVVVEHIPQLNPKGKEIVADVHVQPGNTSKIQSKVTRSNDYQVMAKSLIMPITKEHSALKFTSSSKSLDMTREKIHGLTKAQHKLRKQGYHVDQPKTESDGKGKKPSDNHVSVFDRLGTPTARPSVFERLGSSNRIPNIHDRLGASSIPQSSIFNRVGGGSTQQLKKRNRDGETDMTESRNNNQTLILSQPQGTKSSLVLITIDGTVKVKQRIISNSRHSNENNPNENKVEVIINSNYAAVD